MLALHQVRNRDASIRSGLLGSPNFAVDIRSRSKKLEDEGARNGK